VENGAVDTLTGGVISLAYAGGHVWQEAIPSWSPQPAWWEKTGQGYDGWGGGAGSAEPPVPITRVFLGGGNNEASNPADWSPNSLPQAGDFLSDGAPVMNITGNAVAGDAIGTTAFGGSNAFNLAGNVPVTFAGSGNFGGTSTINLAANTHWTGGLNSDAFSFATVNGPSSASWTNNAADFDGGTVIIGVNVNGSGTINVNTAHGSGSMEFMHAVGSGQTISATGGGYNNAGGNIIVDDLPQFKAAVSLAFGDVTLKGLSATSYELGGGVIHLFNGNSDVFDMRLSVLPASASKGLFSPGAFGVSQVGSNVIIHQDNASYASVLPVGA
jgi:hypothetical protein